MADTQTFKQHSFSTENDQVEGYQRLSQLAVWSVPLGLLSALALVSPLLWFVPIVAVTFALGGLWRISLSDDTTGRRLAITGLGLAILFGTWGVAWTMSRRLVINHQAREHALEWLTLMQKGEYMTAHQLSLAYSARLPPGSSLEKHYAEKAPSRNPADGPVPVAPPGMPPGMEASAYANLEYFKTNGIQQVLVAANGGFEFAFLKNLAILRDGQSATKVDQIFRLTFSQDHEPREMQIKIEMKRTVAAGKAYWQVGPVAEALQSS